MLKRARPFMKILMFGWEFPPHISGGLGTACHGLTEALACKNIEILFVVPSLKGGEEIKLGQIIGADEVIISTTPNRRHVTPTPPESSGLSIPEFAIQKYQDESVSRATQTFIKQVTVPSKLSPYRNIIKNEGISETEDVSVEHWNYSFQERYSVSQVYRAKKTEQIAHKIEGVSYSFTGGYGPTLMNEVYKYAIVSKAIAEENVFDIIHAHDWMTFPAAIAAKKISSKPLIVHVHSTEFDRAGENGNPVVQQIEKEAMTLADRVITVSQRTKDIAISKYGITDKKIEVVHNGISPVSRKRRNFATPLGSQIVSFLGRITFQKGPLFFVEAARKVLEKFPNVHFVVAGSGDLLPVMIERVAQLRLSSNFHFTGFIRGEHVEKIWSISDVYVMPSVSEPFGITPLEAIQAGVPVIISNQAGVSEVMPHAMKVNFWDTDSLAEAICSILQYRSLSATLKKNSSEEIKKVTWLTAAKKIKNLYHEFVR